jgi:hypothetical protein
MITYLAINLTNKKFQIGSTVDFKRRSKEHHNGKGDLEFQRSLRKNPENFYWVVSDDDGLDTRDEEQYYLDFYCGTVWCYNHNPHAAAPYYEWTEERKQQRSETRRGDKNPMFGKRGEKSPHYGKTRPPEAMEKTAAGLRGLLYWVNKEGTLKRSRTCPGPDWQRGMKRVDTL